MDLRRLFYLLNVSLTKRMRKPKKKIESVSNCPDEILTGRETVCVPSSFPSSHIAESTYSGSFEKVGTISACAFPNWPSSQPIPAAPLLLSALQAPKGISVPVVRPKSGATHCIPRPDMGALELNEPLITQSKCNLNKLYLSFSELKKQEIRSIPKITRTKNSLLEKRMELIFLMNKQKEQDNNLQLMFTVEIVNSENLDDIILTDEQEALLGSINEIESRIEECNCEVKHIELELSFLEIEIANISKKLLELKDRANKLSRDIDRMQKETQALKLDAVRIAPPLLLYAEYINVRTAALTKTDVMSLQISTEKMTEYQKNSLIIQFIQTVERQQFFSRSHRLDNEAFLRMYTIVREILKDAKGVLFINVKMFIDLSKYNKNVAYAFNKCISLEKRIGIRFIKSKLSN